MDLFSLFAKISLDTSEYDNGLDTAAKKLHEVGKSMSDTGKTLTKWVTAPVAGLGTAIIKTGADYEAGMSKVQAISGATAADIAMLGDEAMRMAAQTKFSTSESAEAYQYMAMAGWDAQQMVDGLSGIMLLASASGESLASTSDIVTDALTAFGLKASDSGRFADVLAAASNSANTNVSMLGESFKYVAPVAGAMGYSVEDVSVALGLMANSGIKASQAGTSLRTAITNMAAPTSNMTAVMKEYGISLTDADGNMLSFAEIMGVLRDRMGGLDEATQAAAASQLFGKEAMSGMLAIINAAPEDFNKLTEAINNSSGTTEEMAAIMNDNAAGAMAMLSSAINVLFTNLSEFLIPAFTEIVRKATEVVNWFNQLDAGTQQLILTIAGIAAVVGPVLIVVGKIVSAIGTIASGIGGLIGVIGKAGTAVKGLFAILAANPIAAVIAAVAALAAGIIVLWNTNEDFRNAVGAIWEAIKGFFVGAWEAIKAAWESAGEFFGGIVNGIKGVFEGIGEFLGGLFTAAWEMVQGAWDAAVGFFTGIWDGIQGVFSVVADVLGGFFSAAWNAIKAVWDTVVGVFQGIADEIHAAFEAVTGFLGDAFSAAWDLISGVWDAAVDFFSGVWEGISGVFSSVAEWFGGIFSEAWEAVTSAWDGVTEFFSGVWEDITGVFSNVWDTFLEIGENIVNGIKEGISNIWGSFTGWVKEKFDGFVGGVKNLLGIHSPSTEFAEIGKYIIDGLMGGMNDKDNALSNQAAATIEVLVGAFGGMTNMFSSIGNNAMNALSGSLGNAISGLQNRVASLMTGIANAAKAALKIHSPSKVFAGIGENMALGLAAGWEDQYSSIKRQIENGMSFAPVSVGVTGNYTGTYGSMGQPRQDPVSRGGDTFNFYSPKALDPVSAAREMRKAKQQMALGYV